MTFVKNAFGNFLMFIGVAIVVLYLADSKNGGGNSLISVTVMQKDSSNGLTMSEEVRSSSSSSYAQNPTREEEVPSSGSAFATTKIASDAAEDKDTSSTTDDTKKEAEPAPATPAAETAQKKQKKEPRGARGKRGKKNQQNQVPPSNPEPAAPSANTAQNTNQQTEQAPPTNPTPAAPAANIAQNIQQAGRGKKNNDKPAAQAAMPAASGDMFDPSNLHLSELPKYTKEQLMDHRDLYANIHMPTDYKGENLASISGMRKLLLPAREAYMEYLRRQDQYGEYADKIFFPGVGGRTIDSSHVHVKRGGLNKVLTKPHHFKGKDNFVEKLKMKILQAQIKFLQTKNPSTTFSRFVHLHGGHSAAAGHGNLFEESYTAVAEKMLRPILRRVGINYVGRNMAAGGTGSADEVSMCSVSYFGYEADLMSFDYGMIDGKVFWKAQAYSQRAAIRSQFPPYSDDITDVPSRPAILAVHANMQAQWGLATQLKRNLTALTFNHDVHYGAMMAIPNVEMIKEQEKIDALPDYVRNFKCGGTYEKGAVCGGKKIKYSTKYPECDDRPAKASWHPGFKMHAVEGHLIAMGILDHLEEAMKQLEELEPQNESKADAEKRLTALFWEINNAEQARYDGYMDIEKWEPAYAYDQWVQGGSSKVKDLIHQEELMTLPNFCHLAKLPADQRYRGLVTQNFETTTINVALNKTYDNGFSSSAIGREQDEEGFIMQYPKPHSNDVVLVSNHQYDSCRVLTLIDSRDVFFISSKHGWRNMELPNEAESQFYTDFDGKKAKGWIMVCFGACSWGKCDPKDVRPQNKAKEEGRGRLEITVNGQLVTGFADDAGGGCQFMTHDVEGEDKSQRLVWPPNKKGKWSIRMRVADSQLYGFTKISSFIIW